MRNSSSDVYKNGHLVGKVDEKDLSDGSHQTTISTIHHRDIFGSDSASIVETVTTDKNGNVHIKSR